MAHLVWHNSSGDRCDTYSRCLWLLQSIDLFSFRKGVIWLLLATVAEVPPVVCLPLFSAPFVHLYCSFVGIR